MSGTAVRIIDMDSNIAKIDRVSGNFITIARVHHETHEGELYDCEHVFTAVADTAAVNISFTTPAGVYPHLSYEVSGSGDCTVEFLNGSTYTGGTALTAYNRNLNSANKTGVFVHTATITDPGTVQFPWFVPAGGKKGGAGGSDFPEKVLQPSTLYSLRVTNISGGAADFGVSISYYESSVV